MGTSPKVLLGVYFKYAPLLSQALLPSCSQTSTPQSMHSRTRALGLHDCMRDIVVQNLSGLCPASVWPCRPIACAYSLTGTPPIPHPHRGTTASAFRSYAPACRCHSISCPGIPHLHSWTSHRSITSAHCLLSQRPTPQYHPPASINAGLRCTYRPLSVQATATPTCIHGRPTGAFTQPPVSDHSVGCPSIAHLHPWTSHPSRTPRPLPADFKASHPPVSPTCIHGRRVEAGRLVDAHFAVGIQRSSHGQWVQLHDQLVRLGAVPGRWAREVSGMSDFKT